jgi:hypothetical protein
MFQKLWEGATEGEKGLSQKNPEFSSKIFHISGQCSHHPVCRMGRVRHEAASVSRYSVVLGISSCKKSDLRKPRLDSENLGQSAVQPGFFSKNY